jgi:hypothetical protein
MYRPPKGERKRGLDDSGIAYGWLVISIFLILAGILYAELTGVVDSFLNGPNNDNSIGINHDIIAGKQSQQSANAIQFGVSMFTNIPWFILTGAFVFAITRAIVVKRVP